MPIQDFYAEQPVLADYQLLGAAAGQTATGLLFDKAGNCIGTDTLTVGATELAADADSIWTTAAFDNNAVCFLPTSISGSIYALPGIVGVVSSTLKEQTLAVGLPLGRPSPAVWDLAASLVAALVVPPAITPYRFIVDATDELLISASARKLWGGKVFNLTAAPVYVKFYDKATAPTSADTPIWSIECPANSTSSLGAEDGRSIPSSAPRDEVE